MRHPTEHKAQKTVRAAGGIVLREHAEGLQLVLVHRPEQSDWTFPKGKLEGEESDEAAALREVAEETGYRCELGVLLGSVSYRDGRNRPKVVRYFLMRPIEGTFAVNDEVDELRWVSMGEAARLLSYRRDRELLEQLDALSLAPSRS
jgi:8-oxo-dGTP diphosphatase